MKIIDAICEIPDININGYQTKLTEGYKCHKYTLGDNILLSSWTTNVCEKLLERNNIPRDEIGVIINSSISLLETTEKGNSAAPGLCNAIQKKIKASNAFAFEMFQGDWPTTLRVANDFLTDSPHKYALIVHTDKLSECTINEKNGFAMPDGVGAMLIQSQGLGDNLENSYYHLDADTLKDAEFHIIINDDLNNDKMKFRLGWNYNSEVIDLLNSKLTEIIENDKLNNSENMIVESWFPNHKANNYNYSSNYSLGKFSIPWQLQNSLKDINNNQKPIVLVSYNPFLSQYSVLKIK